MKEEHEPQHDEKATFLIHVRYRQNATWQGQVTWAEKKVKKNFRSFLELLELMESAVEIEVNEWDNNL